MPVAVNASIPLVGRKNEATNCMFVDNTLAQNGRPSRRRFGNRPSASSESSDLETVHDQLTSNLALESSQAQYAKEDEIHQAGSQLLPTVGGIESSTC